jgi:mono/diheme cytochrome c family protein
MKAVSRARISLYALSPIILPLLLAGCHSAQPATPLDQLNAQQLRGHDVFQAHCRSCHTDRSDDALHGPTLLGVFRKPYLQSGAPANDDRVTAVIYGGHGMMPPIQGMDPDSTADVLAYLHTL